MKIRVVPQGEAMERIASGLGADSDPRREFSMAAKQKQSSGESRGRQRSDESKPERAKPAEARSHSRDSDDAHHGASRGERRESDDKREHASERASREDDTRARAEHAESGENR